MISLPELIVAGLATLWRQQADRVVLVDLAATVDGPDVILWDPSRNGVRPEDVAKRCRDRRSRLVAFAWTLSRDQIGSALAAGARGWVSPNLRAEELIGILERAHRNEQIPGFGDGGLIPPAAMRAARGSKLSPRECDVLSLICAGLSNHELAETLHVSPNSVKTYVRNLYRKLGVARRSQAVAWGLREGFDAPLHPRMPGLRPIGSSRPA